MKHIAKTENSFFGYINDEAATFNAEANFWAWMDKKISLEELQKKKEDTMKEFKVRLALHHPEELEAYRSIKAFQAKRGDFTGANGYIIRAMMKAAKKDGLIKDTGKEIGGF